MSETGDLIRRKLHETYSPQQYDNTDLWAGNLSAEIDDIRYDATLARAYVEEGKAGTEAVFRAEVYAAGIDPGDVRDEDVQARLWTDVNERGTLDERGVYQHGDGTWTAMRVAGTSGNNVVFESDTVPVRRTGVFHYSPELSADGKALEDRTKAWVPVNDIGMNRDGLLVVSPFSVRACPSMTEVCVRKVGAKREEGRFLSGTFRDLRARLDRIPTDVIYLLPFFEPGTRDFITGEDVRKGELGSVYAVKDFFRIDPDVVGALEEADFTAYVEGELIRDADLQDLVGARQRSRLRRLQDLTRFGTRKELVDWAGKDALVQLAGRAELRALTREAHERGKRVIFDLVLKQTSRDCPLIRTHPEWYEMDEHGRPKINRIAWLVYSDVAVLDLPFNKPLQNYLSGIAPFWMRTCGLDGVRLDASQTIDRPFLKLISNRIHETDPDAIVLGETLCDLKEAVDIPVDMVYALLVDFHRDAGKARRYIDFLEYTSSMFARRTVALAYFENHDSPRATRIWRERYGERLSQDGDARRWWRDRTKADPPERSMALVRNLQASVIDATAGSGTHTNLAYGLEWGTTWGEEVETDFENPTLLDEESAKEAPGTCLVRAYEAWADLRPELPELAGGAVYFLRNDFEGGDPADELLAYYRHTDRGALLVAHNLSPTATRGAAADLSVVRTRGAGDRETEVKFDTYAFFFEDPGEPQIETEGNWLRYTLEPLRSMVVRVR